MLIGEDGSELRKVRNLGKRSEDEILEKLEELKKEIEKKAPEKESPKTVLVKPKRNVWNESIESFRLSERSLLRLQECGIETVKDLYATNPKMEPGWYAVRELFSKIAMR